MRWISYRYGFGTYLHLISDYVGSKSNKRASQVLNRLIKLTEVSHSNVYVYTLISPSYTSAIAQAVQLPGISGKENNLFLFEFHEEEWDNLGYITENLDIVRSSGFDIGILHSTGKGYGFKREIHVWFSEEDLENANLMILMTYVILGHKEWKRAFMRIFAFVPDSRKQSVKKHLVTLSDEGRLSIAPQNIKLINGTAVDKHKSIVNQMSKEAALVMIGFNIERLKGSGVELFQGYSDLGNILFLNAKGAKEIE